MVVWGNCQAEPLAALIREPLRHAGLEVASVPPVFLATEDDLARTRALLARTAFLISQPVRDNYRVRGCGTEQLAGHLPPSGRLVTFPVIFHIGMFPYQVNAHGSAGERVEAPLTDYHDLRAIVAARRGLDVGEALSWWPAPAAAAVREVNEESVAELGRREQGLDVAVSPVIDRPDAMWTISHPTNAVLASVAEGVLAAMGVDGTVEVPPRQFLGERQAPREEAVLTARGWPAGLATTAWVFRGRAYPLRAVLEQHLPFYAARPDVVTDALTRYADRLALLGL